MISNAYNALPRSIEDIIAEYASLIALRYTIDIAARGNELIEMARRAGYDLRVRGGQVRAAPMGWSEEAL